MQLTTTREVLRRLRGSTKPTDLFQFGPGLSRDFSRQNYKFHHPLGGRGGKLVTSRPLLTVALNSSLLATGGRMHFAAAPSLRLEYSLNWCPPTVSTLAPGGGERICRRRRATLGVRVRKRGNAEFNARRDRAKAEQCLVADKTESRLGAVGGGGGGEGPRAQPQLVCERFVWCRMMQVSSSLV